MPRRTSTLLLFGGVILSASTLIAGEFAILANGSRITIDRHEMVEGVLRLYAGQGYTELPASSVDSFETFEDTQVAMRVDMVAPSPVQKAAR